MIETNPYIILFDGLWALVESSTTLTDLVEVGNRIKYNQNVLDPEKEHIQHADLPELRLMATSFQVIHPYTSNATKIISRWDWIISSGSYRANQDFLQVKWALDDIIAQWCDATNVSNIRALLWNGKKFVAGLRIISDVIGLANPQRNRNIKGWSSLTSFEVDIIVPTSEMVDQALEIAALETQDLELIQTQDDDNIVVQGS